MATPVLANADIALFTDPAGTRVVLPRVKSQTDGRPKEQTIVRFEGHALETQFRGEGQPRSYQLTVRFLAAEHATMGALLALFDTAHAASDGRLLLRLNAFNVADLNPIEAITVENPTRSPVGGQAWDVSFVAHAVEFSLAV